MKQPLDGCSLLRSDGLYLSLFLLSSIKLIFNFIRSENWVLNIFFKKISNHCYFHFLKKTPGFSAISKLICLLANTDRINGFPPSNLPVLKGQYLWSFFFLTMLFH